MEASSSIAKKKSIKTRLLHNPYAILPKNGNLFQIL